MKKTLLLLPLLTALGGAGLVAAEHAAGSSLDTDVRDRVEALAPDGRVTDANVRGRPYLLSRTEDQVSTAYVEIAPTQGRKRHMVLVQDLDLEAERAQTVRTFVWLPYPSAGTTPITTKDGAFTEKARVNGQPVRFDASYDGKQIIPSARGGAAPEPVSIKAPRNSTVAGVSAMDTGLAVELSARDVETGQTEEARSSDVR